MIIALVLFDAEHDDFALSNTIGALICVLHEAKT